MTQEIERYHSGPGFASGNPASYDGAVKAAPVKQTQEKWIVEQITASGPVGLTSIDLWDVLPPEFGEVQLSTIRARITTLKLASKIVPLPERREARFGVAIHAYVLPQYGPRPINGQGELWVRCDG